MKNYRCKTTILWLFITTTLSCKHKKCLVSLIYLSSYAQEHSDQKAVHSIAVTVAIFQEKIQGSLGNHFD